ncbi:MAG: class I SAM-dependent methyltransferase [Alphaproteobacteria bacterium]|nr:class I SAM-dependent methyltransferase [Alphaproteobacteria bacterium]
MLASHLLKHLVKIGNLRVIDADGAVHEFKGDEGRTCAIRLHDRALHRKLFFRPELYIGEAYMDGSLTIEEGSLYDFLDLCGVNMANLETHPSYRLSQPVNRVLRRIHQFNPIGQARKHVAHHYDLSDTLYDLFLDKDRHYSCAYFRSGNDDLEAAQANKMKHIAAKLLLRPGQNILDIGSGWGGMGLYLARASEDSTVTGITLSTEQHAVSNKRAKDLGLDGRVQFELRDYRNQSGTFDRIVSVGMFEHVGASYYTQFFRKVKGLLAEDGVVLLHSIGRMEPPGSTNPWIRKYVFPGGYTPALSEVMRAVEKVGLWITDIEILRLHYADTLREWRRRFANNRDKVIDLYDERFCRMWEFYLTGSEISFRHMNQMVFQMQLAKRQDVVPLTRDYITDWERTQSEVSVAAE